MAPVVRALKKHRGVESVVCVTAQHRQMLDQVLQLFDITPDIDLNLMRDNQGVGDFAATALEAINRALDEVKPDVVLVQGDTTTASMAALAAFYRRIPVGHIEAGLRTNDPENPFPEEINRRLADVVSRYHFAPTRASADALRREGYAPRSIHVTGNTVVDALQFMVARTGRGRQAVLVKPGERLIVLTSHRREAFGEPLRRICQAVLDVAAKRPDVRFVYPVHLNPNVRGPVHELLGQHPRIDLIEPLPYDGFVRLMSQATLIVTDSGGIQEEAPALGVPVVIIRDKTERGEAITAGAARLAGTTTAGIVKAVLAELSRKRRVKRNVFGDGRASERIVRIIVKGGRTVKTRRSRA